MPKVNTRADSLSHVNDASAWKKTWKPSICELSIRFCKNCKCHARMPRTSTTPNDSLMSNERWVYLARTVNMHRNIRSVYDHIFCNFPANNTVYTPYIYGSDQPNRCVLCYVWHMYMYPVLQIENRQPIPFPDVTLCASAHNKPDDNVSRIALTCTYPQFVLLWWEIEKSPYRMMRSV